MDLLDWGLSKTSIGFSAFFYLKTEAQAASETYYFTKKSDDGQIPEKEDHFSKTGSSSS
jgi:hypothetical protein